MYGGCSRPTTTRPTLKVYRCEVARTVSTRSSVRALRALARAYGVQRRYRGADRVDHTVSDDTLGAVLRLLGVELHTLDDAPEGLRAYEAARARDVVEPVLVQWGAQPLSFDVRVPTSVGDRSLHVSLRREDGDDVGPDQPMPADALVVHPGVTAGMRRITLAPLPFGPYRLHVDTGSRQGDAVVLAVPKRLAPAGRQWGVFAPTYAFARLRPRVDGNARDPRSFRTLVRRPRCLRHWHVAAAGDVLRRRSRTARREPVRAGQPEVLERGVPRPRRGAGGGGGRFDRRTVAGRVRRPPGTRGAQAGRARGGRVARRRAAGARGCVRAVPCDATRHRVVRDVSCCR